MEQILILQDIDCNRFDFMPGTGIYGIIRCGKFSRPSKHQWNQHVVIVDNSLCSRIINGLNITTICDILLLN